MTALKLADYIPNIAISPILSLLMYQFRDHFETLPASKLYSACKFGLRTCLGSRSIAQLENLFCSLLETESRESRRQDVFDAVASRYAKDILSSSGLASGIFALIHVIKYVSFIAKGGIKPWCELPSFN